MSRTPSMDDKATPSPPEREVWQYEADKLIGANSPPWPSDEQRRAALARGGFQRIHRLEDGELHPGRRTMQEVNLIIGIKASEGTLKLEIIEATPDETTLSEAAERAQHPDFDYITVVKAHATAQPEATPKE